MRTVASAMASRVLRMAAPLKSPVSARDRSEAAAPAGGVKGVCAREGHVTARSAASALAPLPVGWEKLCSGREVSPGHSVPLAQGVQAGKAPALRGAQPMQALLAARAAASVG